MPLITSVCNKILIVCHLLLGSDWPSASEYRGCTGYAFSKYLCYSLQTSSEWCDTSIQYKVLQVLFAVLKGSVTAKDMLGIIQN